MRHKLLILLVILLHFGPCVYAQVNCFCEDCPVDIPDGATIYRKTFIVDSLTTTGNKLLCGVTLNFSHFYLSDLNMQLIAPSGEKVDLIGPIGFYGATYNSHWDITFVRCDSSGITPDPGFWTVWNNDQGWQGFQEYTGTYYPYGGCLEVFDNSTITGVWELIIIDGLAVDDGVLLDFDLQFCEPTVQSCVPLDTSFIIVNNTICSDSTAEFESKLDTNIFTHVRWIFEGGEPAQSTEINPTVKYSTAGTYDVTLVAYAGADSAIFYQPASIIVYPSVIADLAFIVKDDAVTLYSANATTIEYTWNNGPYIPPYPLSTLDTVRVTLIASNFCGTDTLTGIYDFNQMPIASFNTATIGNLTIECTNTSSNADAYHWNISDGFASDEENIVHSFALPGVYSIELEARNNYGVTYAYKNVNLLASGLDEPEQQTRGRITVTPNPGNGRIHLMGTNIPANQEVTWLLYNTAGLLLKNGAGNWPLPTLDFSEYSNGLYTLEIRMDGLHEVLKVVIQRD